MYNVYINYNYLLVYFKIFFFGNKTETTAQFPELFRKQFQDFYQPVKLSLVNNYDLRVMTKNVFAEIAFNFRVLQMFLSLGFTFCKVDQSLQCMQLK